MSFKSSSFLPIDAWSVGTFFLTLQILHYFPKLFFFHFKHIRDLLVLIVNVNTRLFPVPYISSSSHHDFVLIRF